MKSVVIRVAQLSKRYEIGVAGSRHDTLRDHFAASVKSLFHRNGKPPSADHRPRTFWALRDLSFDVKEGEVVGIIGNNGAGKSTLLKILSRITKPTEGEADIHGRVGSLLEVGTGFHPELTGRENVYLNGAILGMKKTEIERKFDDIVAFADIEKFMDTPVKRYSSGMYVRLAFAVAAHLEPEVLIVDEVLAVGDTAFQKKCVGKLGEAAGHGRTVMFVSHNMAAVQHLCNRVILLDAGRIAFSGTPGDAIDYYLNSLSESSPTSHVLDLTEAAGRPPTYTPTLTRLELFSGGSPLTGALKIGDPLRVHVSFLLPGPTTNFNVTLMLENMLGQRILDVSSLYHPMDLQPEPGLHTMICDIPSFTLLDGEYRVNVFVDIDGVNVDRVLNATQILVAKADYYGGGKLPDYGFMVMEHRWYHEMGKNAL